MKPQLSVDEAVATICKSTLTTVITEGRDDYIVYRKIEERLQEFSLSFFPVGGRDAVLQVWQKVKAQGKSIIAIVDKDQWLYAGVPNEYVSDDLIVTDGYSLENDIFRDGKIENLLTAAERTEFLSHIDQVCEWYEHSLNCISKGVEAEISTHPRRIVAGEVDYGTVPAHEKIGILNDYTRLLRGKTLFSTIMMQLARSNRTPKHSYLSLYEIVASAPAEHLQRIEAGVRTLAANDYN